MIKGIVFDLDDTLYPFTEYLGSGFKAVARYAGEKYGVDPEESYTYMKVLYARYGEREVLARTMSYFSLESSVIIELMSVFREHRPSLALFPGYRKTLQSLAAYYVLGMLADGDPEIQNRKVNALRVLKFFKNIIFTGKYDESKWKPNPFCFTLMARVLNLHPRELVYVADNPLTDFIGAKKAGYFTVQVQTSEFRDRKVPMEFEAHCSIKDINELQEYLNEYFR